MNAYEQILRAINLLGEDSICAVYKVKGNNEGQRIASNLLDAYHDIDSLAKDRKVIIGVVTLADCVVLIIGGLLSNEQFSNANTFILKEEAEFWMFAFPEHAKEAGEKKEHYEAIRPNAGRVDTIHDDSQNWTFFPLVVNGQDLADLPSAQFNGFYDFYYLESGNLVFIASVKCGKKELKGLFSLNKNGLQTIIVNNNQIRTPITERLFSNFHIKFLSDWDESNGYFFDGRNLLYLNVVFKEGLFSKHTNVYSWDGESLQRVMVSDDVISVDGQNYTIRSAKVLGTGHGGAALLCYITKAGLGYEKIGLALHCDRKTIPLIQNVDIQGTNRIKKFDEMPKFMAGVSAFFGAASYAGGGGPFDTFGQNQILSDAIIVVANIPEDNKNKGIFRITSKGIDKILEINDDYPLLPGQFKIMAIHSIFVLNPEKILISLWTDCKVGSFHKSYKQPKGHVILYEKGRFTGLSSVDLPFFFHISDAVAIPDNKSSILYCCSVNAEGIGNSEKRLYLLHENVVHFLNHNMSLSHIEKFKMISYPEKGVLIAGNRCETNAKGEIISEVELSRWLLKFDSLDKELQPVPVIKSHEGESIEIDKVIPVKDNEGIDNAYYVTSEGVFQIQKTNRY